MGDVDKAAIIAEILEATSRSTRQAGDLDKQDLSPVLDVNVTTVPARMKPLVNSGAFETLMVYDRTKGRTLRVWRKV